MKVSKMGERKLVELAKRVFKTPRSVKVGIGDDGAVISLGKHELVVTTDMLASGTDFPSGTTPFHMGWKAVVANLSDLAAMGARPLGILFSLGLPGSLEREFVEELLRGMKRSAKEHGTYVIGGDFGESPEVTICGTAVGKIEDGKALKRSGAKPGDLLAITGEPGCAAAGLEILNLKMKGHRKLVESFLKPRARLREGVILARRGWATSAIDVSDGLIRDLWNLSKGSGVKLVLERGKIPVSPALLRLTSKLGRSAWDFVLYGGEDFELIFTVSPRRWNDVERMLGKLGTKVSVVGRVEKGRGVFLQEDGKTMRVRDFGYEHFTHG